MSEPVHTVSARSALVRWAYFAAGWLLTAIGIAGVILPVMPGTVFLILAAACFARSSPRFEAWLVNHPRLGPSVKAWRETGAIPRKAKALAAGAMTASLILMVLTEVPLIATLATAVIFALVNAWMMTRPEA